MTRGVSPGCKRVNVDLPDELHAKVVGAASAPPAIPLAEYIRRLLAWKVGYALPSREERRRLGVRMTGEPKAKTGPKT